MKHSKPYCLLMVIDENKVQESFRENFKERVYACGSITLDLYENLP